MKMLRRTSRLSCLLALTIAAAPLGASAQAGENTGDVTIAGSIGTIDAAGNMDLNDDQGYTDTIRLDGNTVIRPSGAQLVAGMSVTVVGLNRGSYLAAERVDIAAQSVSNAPVPPVAPVPPGAPPVVTMVPPPQAPPSYAAPVPDRQPPLPSLPPQLAGAGDLTGTLDTPLDSRHATVGDNVVLTDVASADGSIRHAALSGTVAAVTRAGQGRNAQIEIAFDLLQLRDGSAYRINGVVESMQVATKSNTLKEIGGALAGMLIGNAVVKTALGVSGGGIAGAVGGYFIAKDNRADVVLPDHSAISVRLLNARRQAS